MSRVTSLTSVVMIVNCVYKVSQNVTSYISDLCRDDSKLCTCISECDVTSGFSLKFHLKIRPLKVGE
jgi:hypothetical protein